jgi:protein TonB
MLQLDYAYTRHAHRRGAQPHLTAIMLVGGLHVIIAFGLINALGDVEIADIPDITVTGVAATDPDQPLPPPPPPPAPRLPEVVPPVLREVVIATPPPTSRDVITERPADPPGTDVAPPPPPVTPPRAIVETQTGPTYPVLSRRLREEGTVRLRLTVGTDGSVIAADIIQSSGHMRLDDAAVDWVLRHWRYEPAMQGTMPLEATTEAALEFQLR